MPMAAPNPFARAQYLLAAHNYRQLPPDGGFEVAFAGRSNAGKSSALNALCQQNALARVSKTPGRTQQLVYFEIKPQKLLVDLPGYGWAKASKVAVKKFQNLGRDFLRGRANLKRAYLLIDARHGLKEVDEEPMAAFDKAAVSYQIILTKADKLKVSEVEAVRARTEAAIRKRPAAFPRVLATSSEKGHGIPELRAEIMSACEITL